MNSCPNLSQVLLLYTQIGMMCCNELFDEDCTLLDVAYISRWTVVSLTLTNYYQSFVQL